MTLEPDWLNIKKWLRTFMDSPNSLGFGKWFPHSDHGHHMGSMWNGSMVWFRYPIHCCHFCLKLRIQWKITDFLWDFVCRVPAVRWGVCRFRPSSCMERRINWFPWHSPRHLWRRCKGCGAQFNGWWMLKFVTPLRVLKHGNRKSPKEVQFFYVFFWEHHVLINEDFPASHVWLPEGTDTGGSP